MWSDFIHSVLPVITAAGMGLVGVLVTWFKNRVEKKVDENTAITQEGNDDVAKGFKDMGQWRYATDKQLAILTEKIAHLESSNDDVKRRVERIPTESQFNYKMEMTPISPLPVVAPAIEPVGKKK